MGGARGRRSPPPPRTQRSHQGSRTPCHRLAPPPRLVQHPSASPSPTGAAGFSLPRARRGAGAGAVSAMGASLGLCPGPGRVPTPGGLHPPGLVRLGARCHRGAAGCAVSQLSAQCGLPLPSPPLCFADPAACSCRLPRLVARFQPHIAYLSSSLHPTARVYPPCLPRSPQHVKA